MVNMKSYCALLVLLITLPYLMTVSTAFQCGRQAGGARCANNLCCSQYGYCGSTSQYCGSGCQSQCLLSNMPNESNPQAQAQAKAYEAALAQARAHGIVEAAAPAATP